jgi:hypothetical protein
MADIHMYRYTAILTKKNTRIDAHTHTNHTNNIHTKHLLGERGWPEGVPHSEKAEIANLLFYTLGDLAQRDKVIETRYSVLLDGLTGGLVKEERAQLLQLLRILVVGLLLQVESTHKT